MMVFQEGKEIRVESFSELKDEITKYHNYVALHPNFLFRGQADKSWSLEPSFTRIAIMKNLTQDEAIQLERECITKFMIRHFH